MDPATVHRELTSGDAGRLRTEGDELVRASQELDDVCNDVLDGLTVDWEGGLSRAYFEMRGQDVYTSTALAAWRLFRCGDLLLDVATQYELVCDDADALLRQYDALPQAVRDLPPTRVAFTLAMSGLRGDWSSRLSQAAGDLTDDTEQQKHERNNWFDSDRASDEDWAREGAQRDFLRHLREGTRLGPRLSDSYLNSGKDWVQQGLAFDRGSNNLLASSYRVDGDPADPDNPKQSALTLYDRDTGAETGSATMAGPVGSDHGPQHSGGVTVFEGNAYVVSSEDGGSYLYRYPIDQVRQAQGGETIHATARIPVPASSYVTTAEGQIHLGRFEEDEDEKGDLYSLTGPELDGLAGATREEVDAMTRDGDFVHQETPPKINGATILPDSVLYNQNWGRAEDSQVIEVPRGGGPEASTPAPPLIEESADAGDALFTNQEAGAGSFTPSETGNNGDAEALWAQTHMTLDPDGAGGRGGPGDSLDVSYQSLRGASRIFAGVSDDIGGVRGRVRGTSVPSSTMGTVDGAATMSSAIGTQADKISGDLDDAVEGAEVTFEGLRDTASGFEVTDLDAFNMMEVLASGLT